MIRFTKMQAIGNDFIIIDCTKDSPKYNYNILSKFLCDRNFGVGADGVIYFFYSKIADIKMKIFNNDGTEAEMCGNGIRCLAKLLYERNIVKKNYFKIETLSGIKDIKIIIDNNKIEKIRVNMGRVIFKANMIPVFLSKNELKEELNIIEINYKNKIFKFIPVSVGNPHAVCFVENFSDFNFEEVGSFVENSKYFPKKTNVEFVKIDSNNKLRVKVWERGVGKTLGCGTGAVACASVAIKKLHTESEIIVELDGGKIEINEKNGEFFLLGNAEFVYDGVINKL